MIFGAGVLGLMISSSQGAGLVNGDFEVPTGGATSYSGTPVIPGFGWQVAGGSIDILAGLWQNAHGSQSIDLNGSNTPNAQGSIYQDFTFASAGTWEVVFSLSVNPDTGSDPRSMNVTFGTTGGASSVLGTYSLSAGTRTYSNMQWFDVTTPTFNIPSTATSYRLGFNSLSALSDWGMALDNVRLVQVPEPATGSLLVGGLLVGAGFYRKARK